MCWANSNNCYLVSLYSLALALPPAISWVVEILLMKARRSTVAVEYEIFVRMTCNQKHFNFFISNSHKCRLMSPDGYVSWFVSSILHFNIKSGRFSRILKTKDLSGFMHELKWGCRHWLVIFIWIFNLKKRYISSKTIIDYLKIR